MVDRPARDRAALLLRRFASGRITNFEFDDAFPASVGDPALRAVAGRAWQLYDDTRFVEAVAALTVLQILLSAVYTIVLVRLRGATVGKLLCGLRVRPWESDALPSWGQSAARWLGREGVSNIPYLGSAYSLLDAIWLLWDQRRQCLHDKLPGTVVVRRR